MGFQVVPNLNITVFGWELDVPALFFSLNLRAKGINV